MQRNALHMLHGLLKLVFFFAGMQTAYIISLVVAMPSSRLIWWLTLQEPVLMVGRICCDSEGRLNERSVLLEGSIELSNGMRTKLDLSKLEGFKLFPGQVCTPC